LDCAGIGIDVEAPLGLSQNAGRSTIQACVSVGSKRWRVDHILATLPLVDSSIKARIDLERRTGAEAIRSRTVARLFGP
jgi:hypothetical protein